MDMENEKEFLQNLLCCEDVVASIRDNLETLTDIIPEIDPMIRFKHCHPHHHLDVWEHTLLALSFSPNNFDIRLALLLHDIGKPSCFQNDYGIRHFKGHPEQSAFDTNYILKRLGYDKEYIKYIREIVFRHDTALTKEDISTNLELSKTLFEVQKCDALAHNPEKNEKRLKYIARITELINEMEQTDESVSTM